MVHKVQRIPLEADYREGNAEAVFEPHDIDAMSMALNDVCEVLKLDGNAKAREIVAMRIIELARRGERSPEKLRDLLLQGANGGSGC